jgi:murein DD-endopeptidase MepM/ murein hydrolase activator NlpD
MNKKIKFTIVVGVLLQSHIAFAANVYVDKETMQGSTFTIEVPKHNITEITGHFNDHEIKFFDIERKPDPEEPITRAEFMELLFLNNDFREVDTTEFEDFPDVELESPYYEYIKKAQALDIIHGYTDGKFHPYAPITRGQAAKILVGTFDPPASLQTTILFADVSQDHRFFNFINDTVKARWFQGYPDGLMRPDRHINFLEAEIVIKRAAIPEEFTQNGKKPYLRAFAAAHRLADPGLKLLELNITTPDYGTQSHKTEINVLQRPVTTVRFSLPKEKTDLFGKDAQDKTWAAVDSAKANPSTDRLWDGAFLVPANGEITLGFGDRLYINGSYSGSHFGLDIANNSGTKIYAANSGRITLAQNTPAFGNTIVIDHGHNVFTMYLHMSELKVGENNIVKKGDLIGLMGSTGISSGNHLHYTQFIGDIIVDQNEWIGQDF